VAGDLDKDPELAIAAIFERVKAERKNKGLPGISASDIVMQTILEGRHEGTTARSEELTRKIEMRAKKICAQCGATESSRKDIKLRECGKCRSVWYCCKEHQTEDSLEGSAQGRL